MVKHYLEKIIPYVINKHDDGYYLTNSTGFILEIDELIDIGENLIKFAKKHDNDEIKEYNNKISKKLNEDYYNLLKQPKPKPNGYIYVMECGGRYKIGVSKNVILRKKQLDNRPFPVNIVYKSPLIEDVFEMERTLHEVYSDNRIYGEWFNLDDKDLYCIKCYIEDLI